MALLLDDNSYLKIDINGNYLRYKNRSARNKEKRATSSQEVLAKYQEIIDEFLPELDEIFYYARNKFNEYIAWEQEYTLYRESLENFDRTKDFPLIAQYFPDVKETIPVIIATGKLGLPQCDTLEDVYNYVKEVKIFGPIDEIKDV